MLNGFILILDVFVYPKWNGRKLTFNPYKMKLKYLILLFPLLITQQVVAQESAFAIMKEAEQQAVAQNKKIFVLFHASWCGWCKRMDKEMNTPQTKDFFHSHFVIRHITVMETKKNKD